MDDYINIKAIDTDLRWNQSIAEVMSSVCYRIGFKYKTIALYISHGFLNDTLELNDAEIGVYDLDLINSEFFDKLRINLKGPKGQVEDYIKTLDSEIYEVSSEGELKYKINYTGNNAPIPSAYQLISNSIEPNFEHSGNWEFEINQVREHLTHEYHQIHYDWHYLKRERYQWLHFKELNIFGIISSKFRGYYSPDRNTLVTLEAIIGMEISEYYRFREILTSKIGHPNESSGPTFDETFNHHLITDKWIKNGLVIEIKSAMIPRVDNMRYEIEIRREV